MRRLSRRAKYIVAETESGLGLAMHLGMTGRFTVLHHGGAGMPGAFYSAQVARSAVAQLKSFAGDANPRHDHVIFAMSGGHVIRYNDVRRFGYMTLFPLAEMAVHPLFRGLGAEPLSDELSAG